MSEATAQDVIRNPGRLVAAPTDLTIAFPHGGMALGLHHTLRFRNNVIYREITDEAFGHATYEVLQCGEQAVLVGVTRGFDNDMMTKLFLNSAAGSSSGDRVVSYPGSNPEGSKLSDDAFVLLFSPDDSNNPGLLMYNAAPRLDIAQDVTFKLNREMGFGFSFALLRRTSGEVYDIGKLEDLTLP